ncbi:MAG: hypothetical protein HY719_02745 [Planctomycetes bacterium]|nr:hypothetical protein [Planctomycetota bacterium]
MAPLTYQEIHLRLAMIRGLHARRDAAAVDAELLRLLDRLEAQARGEPRRVAAAGATAGNAPPGAAPSPEAATRPARAKRQSPAGRALSAARAGTKPGRGRGRRRGSPPA